MDVEFHENYPVKNLTSFKVGGTVDKIWFPKNQQEFSYLLKTLKNPLVLGSMSNVIISDKGLRQDVISTLKMKKFEIKGTKIFTDAGVKGPMLAQKAVDLGLSGFEFMIGFPGSVGGNIYMNASAHSQSISDSLVSVCVFDTEFKEIRFFDKKDLKFSYRHSLLQEKPFILLTAEFDLKKTNNDIVKALVERNLAFRKTHQPNLAIPNAGSIFKNPENDSAGRLLDKAGVKDFEVGGATIWQGHANFIVNREGNAKSVDILELMLKMFETVKTKYTIELKPEVKFFGEGSEKENEICKILYKK